MSSLPRWLHDRRVSAIVFAGTGLAVVTVYVVIVLGGGLLIGHTDSPSIGLSVLATAIVALGFEPLRARLEVLATRWVHQGRQSPYDVLSEFSESLGDQAYQADHPDLPLRMARLLAEGTGACWAQVWLVLDGELTLTATWPPQSDEVTASALGVTTQGLRELDVTLADEHLGVLRLQEQAGQPLSPVEERLFAGLAAQAGLVLRGVRLRAELASRAVELAARADDLRISRERLVDAYDEERRKLERDIHDGAQQHLVALVVNLRLAQTLAAKAPERATAVLDDQVAAVDSAIATLVDLSRGIYPRTLSEEGIASAVRAVVGTSAVPVSVHDLGIGRLPEDIEAALYFCCVEAVQNAVKHADATSITVTLSLRAGHATLSVHDDGVGFDQASITPGDGLGNMRDRIDAVSGDLLIGPAPAGGTDIVATVPVAARAEAV
jgi:signal transduction histidine kinase